MSFGPSVRIASSWSSGLVLVAKRLEDGKFRWPKVADAIMRLTAAELQALLEGLDWRRVHEPQRTSTPTAVR
jgi:transposase